MIDLFTDLANEDLFVEIVGAHFRAAPSTIASVMHCDNSCDDDRLRYAAKEYRQTVEGFSVLLKSTNPDHYKRSAALLHALHMSKPIVEIKLESTAEELEAGFTRVTLRDAEAVLPFVEFYETYHNEMMAFDMAYKCCAAYEDDPTVYDLDYLRNVCRYLHVGSNISVDSLFMMFKSLMLR